MTTTLLRLAAASRFSRFVLSAVSCATCLLFQSTALAQDPDPTPVVAYAPQIKNIQGVLPYTESYSLSITSPYNQPSAPSTISFTVDITSTAAIPQGVSAATAISYVTITPAQVTFTGPNQVRTVTVKLSLPANATPGAYGYKLKTTGWPVNPAFGLSNNGADINASITAAAQPLTPPSVTISVPENNSIVNVDEGALPISVPFSFTAIGPGPYPSPVDSVSYSIDGDASPINLTSLATLNTLTVEGSGSITISRPGQHVVTVSAHNAAGTATTTNTFLVKVTPQQPLTPPDVVIHTPFDGQVFKVPYSSLDNQGRAKINLSYTASADNVAPILRSDADVDGTVVTTLLNLNSPTVHGGGDMLVTVGSHTVTARASNAAGDAQDVNDFEVVVTGAPPPVVTIETPQPGTVKIFSDDGPYVVPFTFTAQSVAVGGVIRAVVAMLDDDVTPLDVETSALDSKVVTGSMDLSFDEPGLHQVTVTAVDDYGQAVARTNFTIKVVDPTPVVTITKPSNNEVFTVSTTSSTTNIPFTFKTTTTSGFTVDEVSAVLDGTIPVKISTNSPALGTSALVTSTGTMLNVGVGTHTLTAFGTSSGKTASATVTFVVKATNTPPKVVITSPSPNATFTVTSGQCLSIPLTFTGTSTTAYGKIKQLTAKLDGRSLSVSTKSLNTAVAYGTATMSVSGSGTHVITVTATDSVGTATATQTFTVTVVTPRKVSGTVFYDVNHNGRLDNGESGQNCATVKLLNSSGQQVASTTTNRNGNYTFSNVAPGNYTVAVVAPKGMSPTPNGDNGTRAITVTNRDVTAPAIGLGLDFDCLRTASLRCNDSDYWRRHLDGAISGRCGGLQVPTSSVSCYTKSIGCTRAYNAISNKTACSVVSSSSSRCKDQLNKQLLTAHYNARNGCYLNGDKELTERFLDWGEEVLRNCDNYSSSYLASCRDWFTAFNNAKGRVNGPSSPR